MAPRAAGRGAGSTWRWPAPCCCPIARLPAGRRTLVVDVLGHVAQIGAAASGGAATRSPSSPSSRPRTPPRCCGHRPRPAGARWRCRSRSTPWPGTPPPSRRRSRSASRWWARRWRPVAGWSGYGDDGSALGLRLLPAHPADDRGHRVGAGHPRPGPPGVRRHAGRARRADRARGGPAGRARRAGRAGPDRPRDARRGGARPDGDGGAGRRRAVRRRRRTPRAAERALEAHRRPPAGRRSTDMRRLLGLLRSDDTGTAPGSRGSAEIADLVDRRRYRPTCAAWTPTCRPAVALTAYRVVQESLTNVRKHAGPDARRPRRRSGSTTPSRSSSRTTAAAPRLPTTAAASACSGCASGSPCTTATSRPGPGPAAGSGCPRGSPVTLESDPGVPRRRPADGARRVPDARRQPARPDRRRRGGRRRRGRSSGSRSPPATSC